MKRFVAAISLLGCIANLLSYGQEVHQVVPPKKAREVIVKFRANGGAADRERAMRNASAVRQLDTVLERQGIRAQSASVPNVLTLRDGVAVASEIARLQGNPAVEYVEPNYPIHLLATGKPVVPNDFEFSKMYALRNPGGTEAKTNADIHATEAWKYTTGDSRIIVAVIDTGIDYLHEDLQDNIWVNKGEIPYNGIDDDGNGFVDDYLGYDFVSNDSDPYDDNQHGTHVAGIIGAKGNNEIGTVGVCWNVSLMALKAFDDQGNGTVENAIAAIAYAVRQGARVINASWGLDEKSRALEEAVQQATDAGVLFIAAAGNNRTDAPSYPASFESVLSVAATDKMDARAIFSNYGPTVDVAAPGDGIFSTLPENNYGYLSGTSMAAPHVSGVAALVLARFPQYTRQEVFDILINSIDVLQFDQPIGNGRIDASRAVQMDQPLPTARMTVPATLSGEVPVMGSGFGGFFAGYEVLIGAGKSPSNWVHVASSDQRITNGIVASLNTALVSDGPAVVQLVVRNQNGATAIVNSPVKVLNALISSPMSGDVLAPGKYEVRGTLYGENRSFELSYGAGLNPTSWITLPSTNSGDVLDGKIGEWDTTGLPSGLYCLRMVSMSGAGRAEFIAPAISVDQHLRAGWPVALETDADFPPSEWRNVRIADLDGDGKAEFVVVEPGTRGREQKLFVFSVGGELLWSKTLGFDVPPDVPALGDIDGDGKLEIFVDVPNGVAAFHHDGTAVAGWPVQMASRNHAKVLADLDGDGKLEVITYSQEYSATQVPDMRELAVYGGGGNMIRNWQLPWCGFTNDVQKIFPAVANLDSDPELEIVVVSGCSEIAAFDYRRAEPKWRSAGEGMFLSSPVIGDVDGDGSPDIVVAAAAENDLPTGGVYIFHSNGQRWRGWPVLEEYSFFTAPALGDLDHDGRLEMVLPSDKPSALHVLQWDGFEADGWPRDTFHKGTPRVGVSLADVNGDGFSEIILGAPSLTSLALALNDTEFMGGISAFNLAGENIAFNGSSVIPGLPFESFSVYRFHKASPPVLGDFDGDGLMDVAICSIQERTYGSNLKLKNRSSMYSWQLNTPSGGSALEWPMFAHDVQNRGTYTLPQWPTQQNTNITKAIRDRVIGGEDHELVIEPLSNDFGLPPLSLVSVTDPAHGLVSKNGDGMLVYQPFKDYSGVDEFSYTMRDAKGETSSAKIIVRVKPSNDAPVAEPLNLTVKKNSAVSVYYTASDAENDRLTFRIVDPPRNGELWNYPAVGYYYPRRGFFGTETFTYVASDGKRDSEPALITIDVINSNNPPTAVSQSFMTKTNRSLRIQPVGNDLDNDEVTFRLADGPSHGTVEAEGTGFRFTPASGYVGQDSFTVLPFDGTAVGDAATMSISIIATNAAPKAADGNLIVSPNTPTDIRLPGSDPDGDKVVFTILSQPMHGTLSGEPPEMTYLPATNYVGPDKFTYKLSDGFAESETGTYTLQVVRRNQPPEAEDQTVSTPAAEPLAIGLHLTDPDLDPIRTVILKGPANGLLYGSGTNFIYVPNVGAIGTDLFTYKAWDGQKFGNVGTVTVVVSLPRPELPPTFVSISTSDEIVQLVLSVPNTHPFFIEASTNLLDWTVVSGPIVSAGERYTYRDSNAVSEAQFYRARRQN